MPKLGMEPIRRAALVKAAIKEIGLAGSLDVTVTQIAKRAGVSTALVHHYFGKKEEIFIAAMRFILTEFGDSVRAALHSQTDPRARIGAMVAASFEPDQFQHEVINAWLNFYVQAQTSFQANRLLRVYQNRLRSNLLHELRPLMGEGALDGAEALAALIDGIYIRAALSEGSITSEKAIAQVMSVFNLMADRGK